MSLYNTVVYFPEIQSQVLDTEVDSTYVDERIKVNEAESLFAEFEACLSGQLLRKFSSAAKSCPASAQPLDSLLNSSQATAPTGSTVAVGRPHTLLDTPSLLSDAQTPQMMDSLNMDMPNLSELELTVSTSTTTSSVTTPAGMSPRRHAGRLPPRITPVPSISNRPSVEVRNRNQYPTAVADGLVSPSQLDVRVSSNFTNFGSLVVPISPILPRLTDTTSVESRQSSTRPISDTEVQPLPPLPKKWSVLRTCALGVAVSTLGLIGYRTFVLTPRYHGVKLDMQGKTVLVTECQAKMSRAMLHEIANSGAHLIMTSSLMEQCSVTRDRILRATKASPTRVECRELQLMSTKSVRRFAANLLADHPKLDRIVIQSPTCMTNVVAGKWRPTRDGFEQHLGTDYFAAFLLSCLLWQRLTESKDGRLILVADMQAASVAQQDATTTTQADTDALGTERVKLSLDNFNLDNMEVYEPKKAYQRTQWLLKLFADELHRRKGLDCKASVMIADPNVSLGTAPPSIDYQPSDSMLSKIDYRFSQFTDFGPRLLQRKLSTTPLFCTIAPPERLELDRLASSSTQAPVYQDLHLRASFGPNTTAFRQSTTEAGRILWALSQRWTHLDSHPTPLPLPPRPPPTHEANSPSESSVSTC